MKAISKAKPFIKWVGGKGQLIEQLDAQLPADFGNWEAVTYVRYNVRYGLFRIGRFSSPRDRRLFCVLRDNPYSAKHDRAFDSILFAK